MQKVELLSGTYKIRGKDVDLAGMVFPLVEGFKWGTKGSYVTVDGAAVAAVSYTHLTLPTTPYV